MISIDELKSYSKNLMFEMEENEYVTLQSEFNIFLNWMSKIGEIDNIESIIPMYFPYEKGNVSLRSDNPINSLSKDEVLKNACFVIDGKVSVPRVVK